MYCVCLVLLDYELYIVNGSVNLVVASLKPPILVVRMNKLGAKKMYWSPVWVELMWYASIFSLENQTSSMLKHSNPVHHCSTAQTKIMGPLLSKLHNLQYYVHILPKWVSSKTNFPLLNTLMLQMKFSFLHNVSPPKLTVSVFLTPAPVLCKSLKTAPSKYSLYIGLQGGFQCSVRLIRWPVTA